MAIETMGGAQGVCWNLVDLYKGLDDPKLAADMDLSLKQAVEFEKKYRNVISSLKPSDARVLLGAVRELEALYEVLDKPWWPAPGKPAPRLTSTFCFSTWNGSRWKVKSQTL